MTQTVAHERKDKVSAAAPAVSVIVPAYNCAPYIAETLASVFAQTFADYEVIVINDGSPDTPALERALAPYDSRIIYLQQENRGPSAARNAGLLRARGAYVAFLDSDDLWLPAYLAEQMKALRADPALDLIYTDALLFGDSVPPGLTFMQAASSRGPVTFESLLRFECSIITSCVVARREALLAAGLFDPNFLRSEDYDLWLRLAQRGGRLTYQRQVLARHRVHGASLAANEMRMFESQIEVYRKLARAAAQQPAVLRLIAEQIKRCEADIAFMEGKRLFLAGEFAPATAAFARANDFYRSRRLGLILLGLRVAPRALRRIYGWRHGAGRDPSLSPDVTTPARAQDAAGSKP